MKVTLKTITPEAEINIVEIARVSSSRTDKAEKPEGLLKYLIKNKHWSPFEHSSMTVEIVTSKSIAIQLLRHRSFTFQEFSQRYAVVDQVEDIEFRLQADKNRQSSTDIIGGIQHLPDGNFSIYHAPEKDKLTKQEEAQSAWLYKVGTHLENGLSLYQEAINLGVAKETARFILPQAVQTTLFMTGTIRSWIHMLQIRVDEHAQKEVQLIGLEIQEIFKEKLPIISAALDWKSEPYYNENG